MEGDAAEMDGRHPGEDLEYIELAVLGGGEMPRGDEMPGPQRRLQLRARPRHGPPAGSERQGGAPEPLGHNRPGPKSSSRAWHCEACDCWVTRPAPDGGPGDAWDVHVSGIRHRRSALSLRETGRRGTVVSVFEQGWDSGEHVKPKPATKGKGGLRERWRGEAELEKRIEEFARLRTLALRQLVNHTGTGSRYHAMAERFSVWRLDSAAAILEERRFPRRFFRQRSVNVWRPGSLEFGTDAAMLAALAHAMMQRRLPLHSLSVDVLTPLVSDFPADLAGLVLLVRALCRGRVRRLTICFSNWVDSWPFSALQQLGLALAEEASRCCLPLRRLCLSFPMLGADSVRIIADAVCPEELMVAAAANAAQTRLAVLMATHPRSRAAQAQGKTLADLPPDLLRLVLDDAAPRAPLEVAIEARTQD